MFDLFQKKKKIFSEPSDFAQEENGGGKYETGNFG